MTRLLQVLSLLYRMTDREVADLENRLLTERKKAWRAAIGAEARRFGYRGPAEGPRRDDLTYLRDLCRQDARSIANTLARDVERQLNKLYAANPKGNRHYYIKHMETWMTARMEWKSRQIARQTEFTTVEYAKDRFWQMNGLRGGKFVMAGPPPVCATCVQYFAAGVVDQVYVDRHPLPAHIGCPHTWQLIRGSIQAPSAQELWVG